MQRKSTPLNMMKTGMDLWMLGVETQTVMTMRMLGMSGAWNVPEKGPSEMITKEPEAFGRAIMAASLSMATGQKPDHIMRNATRPLRRKVASEQHHHADSGMA